MKQTAASALNTTTPRELFPTVSVTGRLQVRPNWRILLLGGGTVHPNVRSWIAEWKYGGPYDASAGTVGISGCSVESCRLPANTRLLGLEGRLRAVDASTVSRTDQSILALAVGLAQPPWEIWEYSEARSREHTIADDWRGDDRYVGN